MLWSDRLIRTGGSNRRSGCRYKTTLRTSDPERKQTMHVRLIAILLTAVSATMAGAQSSTPPGEIPGLRAELTLGRSLYFPQEPIRVRFTLFNPTDQTVEIAAPATDDGEAIALPQALVFGPTDQPALSVVYEKDQPVGLHARTPPPAGTGPRRLRLAPHASVGVEIDVTGLDRMFRYPGQYHLEWKPLGGRIPAATLSFRIERRMVAILVTDYGKVTFSLFYEKAPRNVENFLDLARDHFYDRKLIHRIIPGFILQGGSPDGTSRGVRPDGKRVAAEFNDTPFQLGTLAMARKPDDPDSASCQFFISLARLPELDGKYTVIGQASDEESLRTLRRLGEISTDSDGRPLRPVVIRFFTLRRADEPRTATEAGQP